MLRRIALFTIFPVLVVFGYLLALPAVTSGFGHSSSLQTLNAVNQLSRLLRDYTNQPETKGQYPHELSDLVMRRVVSQKDFDKLMNQRMIEYFPPSASNPSSNHIVLLAGTRQFVAYANIAGDIVTLPNNK